MEQKMAESMVKAKFQAEEDKMKSQFEHLI
jgi:hypothetical protein